MTRKRHTEEQLIAVLKDTQGGVSVQDLCRKHGTSDGTFYKWRTKYAGLEASDVKKLRQLEEENRRLNQMVVGQALDLQALKAITAKTGQAQSETPFSAFSLLVLYAIRNSPSALIFSHFVSAIRYRP